MLHLLPLLRRLPRIFGDLKASLLAWNAMGQGLWPLDGWDEERLNGWLAECYQVLQSRLAAGLQREVALPQWQAGGPGEVCNGPDLLLLVQLLISLFVQPGPAGHMDLSYKETLLLQQLEQIQWALTGLVYPEEPGELIVEAFLANC